MWEITQNTDGQAQSLQHASCGARIMDRYVVVDCREVALRFDEVDKPHAPRL
jgi:hypothetical protein